MFVACQGQIEEKATACFQTIFGYITVCFDLYSVECNLFSFPRDLLFKIPVLDFHEPQGINVLRLEVLTAFRLCGWLEWDETPAECLQQKPLTAQMSGTRFRKVQGKSILVILMLSVFGRFYTDSRETNGFYKVMCLTGGFKSSTCCLIRFKNH